MQGVGFVGSVLRCVADTTGLSSTLGRRRPPERFGLSTNVTAYRAAPARRCKTGYVSPAEWITSIATAVGGVGAAVAAFCSARSVGHARRSAELAAQEVELQRPAPVVVIERRADINSLVLSNRGNSPAFDVRISELTVPGFTLTTDAVRLLIQKDFVECRHRMHSNGRNGDLQLFQTLAGHHFGAIEHNAQKED
jgi:hypothetical protein